MATTAATAKTTAAATPMLILVMVFNCDGFHRACDAFYLADGRPESAYLGRSMVLSS